MRSGKARKKLRYKLIYQGFSQEESERLSDTFWDEISPEEKLNAITQAIQEAYLLKGIDFSELRLLRTTAVIRKA